MEIKFYKPYTSSIRHKKTINFLNLSKKYPEKSLIYKNHRCNGRNNKGKITIQHKGGGHKKLYRSINFKKRKFNIFGKILSIEYDPYRNAFISLVYYENHTIEYMLYINKTKIGNIICTINDIFINKFKKILKIFKIFPVGCTLRLK
jgi:large subunit ribosomal protein L2